MLFDVVRQFFEENDWQITPFPDKSAVALGITGINGQWQCLMQVHEEQQQVAFYSYCPVKVPEDGHTRMAEFLTRANYGMLIGNFEMDYTDGEIRFKASLDVEDDRLTSALIKNLVYVNLGVMDRYLPGIMRVMYGEASPAEAIQRLEQGPRQAN